jgi:steroid delta-isomerase-like uncharacterized protein
MSKAVLAVMERWGELWNQGDLAAVDEIIGDDYLMHSSLLGDQRGKEAVRESYQRYRSAFPDMHFTLIDRVVEGDRVVQHWTFKGTHRGMWNGVPATGKAITYEGMNLFRIAHGRIVESTTFWDMGAFLRQAGKTIP